MVPVVTRLYTILEHLLLVISRWIEALCEANPIDPESSQEFHETRECAFKYLEKARVIIEGVELDEPFAGEGFGFAHYTHRHERLH